ncbi:YjbH domain-containing protein [Salinimicrobium sp. TH3]|uniref:YjbH domain-containing protein n=1 Tax=Salinimicrobium sp. TH3 TaxID=2997342 RepID=UPI0022735668|nr:YjbH domain-containing protein [Salinimicrobium sp. TH3]MCY2687784.1 YjbH domain-containing protein [Salinimicrobium sp. TH3]
MGQVNFLGKPGYIATPSAEWNVDRPLGLSFSYLPDEYSIFNTDGDRNIVHFYNVRAGLTSFMEVSLSIAHRPLMSENIGVGDRQLDLRFRLLKEQKYLPAIVLGWTPPGSVAPVLAHDYLVATKNFNTSFGRFTLSGGYGSPYIIKRKNKGDSALDLEIVKKIDFKGSKYLTGFFGGMSYHPFSFGGIMLEYDSQTINAGAYLQPLPWLLLQAHTFEGKEVGFTASAQFPLNFAPRTLRRYEKELE